MGAADMPEADQSASKAGKSGALVQNARYRLRTVGAAIAAIAAVGAVIGGLAGYWNAWKAVSTDLLHAPAPSGPAPTAVPGSPTVAVLPFENRTNDATQDVYADDLTRGMIADLGQFALRHVLGRNATAGYKGRAAEAGDLGRQIGAEYVVTGDLRRSGEGVRAVIEAVDARGVQIWSRSFVARPDGQDEIAGVASSLIGSAQGAIALAEYRRIQSKPAKELTPYECIVQFTVASFFAPATGVPKARECLDPLVKNEPNNAMALRVYTHALLMQRDFGLRPPTEATNAKTSDQLTSEALQAALKAVDLAPNDYASHMALATAYWGTCQRDLMLREADKAIAINPYDVSVYLSLGWRLVAAGLYDRGKSMIEKAIDLTAPNTPVSLWSSLGVWHFARGEYQEALDLFRRGFDDQSASSHRTIAVSLALLGRIDEAKAEMAIAMKIAPNTSLSGRERVMQMQCNEPDFRAKYIEGLRIAGMPE